MLSRFREPGGGFSLIAGGLACLALAGLTFAVLPSLQIALAVALAAAIAAFTLFYLAWKRRPDPYDLKNLYTQGPDEPEDPYRDTVDEDELSAPYCGWCDEPNAVGAKRCRFCGREL